MKQEICPDCNHEKKYHMNTNGCYYPIGKYLSSEIFKGAIERCNCQRLEEFVEEKWVLKLLQTTLNLKSSETEFPALSKTVIIKL